MGKIRRRRAPVKQKPRTEVTNLLAAEFKLAVDRVSTVLRSVGINPDLPVTEEDLELYREVVACKVGDRSRYVNTEAGYEEALDEQLRSFDEIYVDTAPILQKDWFLYFVNDAMAIIKRRKKKLIVLEKTLEELHGLKNNPEKDREVRIRATIRPDLLRLLARRGVVRIGDTGSIGIADDHLVRLFAHVGAAMDLLLITQDRGLSERIVRLGAEMEQKPKEEQPQRWYERLFSKKDHREKVVGHRMVACKLVEQGKLKRLYICPECQESYYDDLHACGGIVLCGRCYLRLKEEEERQVAANRKKREAELKAEEERQRRLEEEERRLEAMRPKETVEDRIILQKKGLYRRLTWILGACVLILLTLLLVL
ncbi:MAG: hypothetical protein RBS49_00730 [Sphaerochaeta sp.]|jgi:uncharacterized protein YqkB/ferredoxin|nr:hypothetical protein [Sphaerochaeta sp.]MDX9914385.1 hypothetical protein [Sphaerochaeta sp.]